MRTDKVKKDTFYSLTSFINSVQNKAILVISQNGKYLRFLYLGLKGGN